MDNSLMLTDEQSKLVTDNIKLVYYYAERFVGTVPLTKDEIHAEMYYGICKAAQTYDPCRKIAFSTYATRCMRNEVLMRLRQEKKWSQTLYLSDLAARTDRMDDTDSSSYDAFLSDKLEPALEDTAVMNVVVNEMKGWLQRQEKYMNVTTKRVIATWLEHPEQTQAELATLTNVSQAQVSRILGKIKGQIISTFFHGDNQFLLDGEQKVSQLSVDFMECAKRTDNTVKTVHISSYVRASTACSGAQTNSRVQQLCATPHRY